MRLPIVALAAIAVVGEAAALGQGDLELTLLAAHSRYLRARSSLETLVTIDAQLRNLNRDRPNVLEFRGALGAFKDLGLSFSRHGDVWYAGKLLLEAHRLNPRSNYRGSTLFSTIWPDGQHRHLAPSPAAAEAYLREFPGGPFANETRLTLARFHHTLFVLLRRLAEGWTPASESAPRILLDIKYACYSRFVTAIPYEEQQQRARQASLAFYRQLVARRGADANVQRELSALEAGSSTQTFSCYEIGS